MLDKSSKYEKYERYLLQRWWLHPRLNLPIDRCFVPNQNRESIVLRRHKVWRERYLSGLIVSENVTITGMNTRFLSRTDQSNFNCFLTSARWSEDELNELRIELLNASHLTKAKRYGVIIIDDTLVHKTGKKVPFAGNYFDPSSGTHSWAQSLVTSHYADGKVSWPINFALYCKREEVSQEEFRTKIELACELFEDALLRKIPAATVLFDAWYLAPQLTRKIEAASRGWIAPVKLNRKIIGESGRSVRIGDWASNLPKEKFKKMSLEDKEVWVLSCCRRISKIGRVRLVVILSDIEGRDELTILATSHKRWDAAKIISTYELRFTIETFYRDTKQHLGLEGAQLRKLEGIKRHWYLIFTAYSILLLGATKGGLLGRLSTGLATVGARCRATTATVLQALVCFVFEHLNRQYSPDEVFKVLSVCIV